MHRYKQFINYSADKKLPINPRNGKIIDITDTTLAVSYEEASAGGRAVGFIFTKNDSLFFIDVDNCVDNSGNWKPIATELIEVFKGAYVEVSKSGRGLHIIGSYIGEEPLHLCKNKEFGIELYTSGRYVALTGTQAVGDSSIDCTTQLETTIEKHFKPADIIEQETPQRDITTEDSTLIALALKSKNPLYSECNFKALWTRDVKILAKKYPTNDGIRDYDYSTADAALAQHLAFWTARNAEQMHRIMLLSSLVRDKWKREDYLHRTINYAILKQKTTYNKHVTPVATASTAETVAGEAGIRAGYQFLSPQQQLSHFAGCVYIQDIHRAFTPAGDLLKPEQFKTVYGGYCFAIDSLNSKSTCNAWQAFTESQALRPSKVQSQCFRPLERSGAIVTEGGRSLVNVHVPIDTPRTVGDVTPFLKHLNTILPIERDQIILLSYLSACIQHKGIKFQWCPLLQGAEGNGKTLFTRCVAQAIGRKYVHFPKAADLDNKFNAWLLNKLFIGVEDIYVPEDKRSIIETLKPMITGGDGIEIQAKGVDQITADICANFIINSNHQDAIRKTANDRRFAIFYCKQQEMTDIVADGLHGDYFPALYGWLHDVGYAYVHNFLATYQIPAEFNPAGKCHRAPETSSTQLAITATLGVVEQEIVEAIEEGRIGFRGGWVSSMALAKLIDGLRRKIQLNKRREMMRALGYDWHRGLPNGRVNSFIMPDGGKPKLFVLRGSPQAELTDVSAITDAYIKAQLNA